MEILGYHIDIEEAAKTITEKGYHTIAMQIPEGLKQAVFPLVDYLEKTTKATVFVIADPCYGACDIANYELKNLDVDCVLHLGHLPIPDVENFWIPTIFVNAFSSLDVSKVVEKSLPLLKGKKIGLVTTAQHVHLLEKAAEVLKQHEFEAVIGQGDDRTAAKGQILGCNFSAATKISSQVDSFLFLGSGMFHPVGLLLSTQKHVVAADPYTFTVKTKEIDELKDVILRQRYGAITGARSAKSFGILLGIKSGQQRLSLAREIKKMLDDLQKKNIFIAMDAFSSESLQGFLDVDCFVSTACPRIAIDDYVRYKKPIITPVELEVVVGKRTWDDYRFDQILKEE